MKKISLICLLAVISCLTSVAFVYAGWPINRTLPIEGTVTDATTGEPIENVIISAEWVKEVFALVDNLQMIVSQKLIVTGKDGRYKIPGKISLHIISRFYKVGISLRHPLYESKVGLGNDYRWNARDKKELKKGTTGWYYDRPEVKNPNEKVPVYGYYKDGKIHFDIKLLSLEEKYREIDRTKYREIYRTKGRNGLPIQIYDLDHEMIESGYFYQAKELGVNKNQLNNFILAWEKMVEIGKYSVEEKDYLKDRIKIFELWLKKKGLLENK